MRISKRTCPKCGSLLAYEEIMARGASFPCPSCGDRLQVPDYYLLSIWTAAIAVPALVFWAFGVPWPYVVVGELVTVYPVVYLALRFVKYIIPPKIEFYLPTKTELHLRDRSRS
jgi:hypothetical protein